VELKDLEVIRTSNIAGSEALALERPSGMRRLAPFGGRLRVNHGLAARAAVLAARSFGPTHTWLVDDFLAEGRLETILPDRSPPAVPLNMLIRPERTSIARVRLLVEFLAEKMLRIPGIERPG
jgi:DNA-binding transcriptional LysR family regulator